MCLDGDVGIIEMGFLTATATAAFIVRVIVTRDW